MKSRDVVHINVPGVGRVMVGLGGLCRGVVGWVMKAGVSQAGMGWIMQERDGSSRGRLGHAGVARHGGVGLGGSSMGGVDQAGGRVDHGEAGLGGSW